MKRLGQQHRTAISYRIPAYTDAQIDELFSISGIGKAIKRLLHKNDVKKLEELNLSFDECKLLYKENHISIESLGVYIGELKLSINHILFYNKHGLYAYQIRELLRLNITSEEIVNLISSGLGCSDIKILNKELSLTPSNILYLLKYAKKEQLLNLDKTSLGLILKISQLCRNKYNSVEASLQSFESIHNSIPSSMIDSALKSAEQILTWRNSHSPSQPSCNTKETLEDVMKFYMDLASGKEVRDIGYADSLMVIFGIIQKLCDKTVFDFFPIKPYILIVIWLAMVIEIEGRFVSDISSAKKEIAKMVLALACAFMTGITGYLHSGGEGLPVNITSYIGSYYKIQKTIENHCEKIYSHIPDVLKFNTDESFDSLTKEMQLSAGSALCMTYTFRIGDNMITTLSSDNLSFIDAVKKIIKSMWPLPMEAESKRMYFMYSGYTVYTSVNMNDVFVQLPSNFS